MGIMFNIIMLVIMVPSILFIYLYEYPAKWRDKKYIFGVLNRAEFKEEKAAERVDDIASTCRKYAKWLLIISLILMVLFCFIPDFSIRLIAWSFFVFVDLVLMLVPFTKGNSEMKSLKRELGIASKKGVVYTDLKGAGAIHALKKSKIIVPSIIATVFFLVALLERIGVVKLVGLLPGQHTYQAMLMTGMTGALLFISLMLIPIAFMMDGIRNEVISEDSDINANYNRAKKKNMADFIVLFTWINTAIILIMMIMMSIWDYQILYLAVYAVYMLAIMIGIYIYANVYLEDKILKINPRNGQVMYVYNMKSLINYELKNGDLTVNRINRGDVLNGIAYIPEKKSFILTGKLWNYYYEIIFN